MVLGDVTLKGIVGSQLLPFTFFLVLTMNPAAFFLSHVHDIMLPCSLPERNGTYIGALD